MVIMLVGRKYKTVILIFLVCGVLLIPTFGFTQNKKSGFSILFTEELAGYRDSLLRDKLWGDVPFVLVSILNRDSTGDVQAVITHEHRILMMPFIAPNGLIRLGDGECCFLRIEGDYSFFQNLLGFENLECLGWRSLPNVAMLVKNLDYDINTQSMSVYLKYGGGNLKSKQTLTTHEEIPKIDEKLWIYESDEFQVY
ncbi:MAG: hypothetical protein ACJAY8_000987 [Sphingobacteriales bacterium]|jgi:hypothetical protein